MSQEPFFSSSSKVWENYEWVFGIEECGYSGWEIMADGNYRLEEPDNFRRISEVVDSTSLRVTVHAPYSDLNLASLNYPIWRESLRQICTCIEHAAPLTDRVTFHPGYVSPVGRMMPDKVWDLQKTALVEIGTCAEEYGVLACLENMINIREFLCRDPGEMFGMTGEIEGIGVTLDIGHANTTGHVREFLDHIGSVSHLHVHDNHGDRDEHLALGAGTIDWEWVGRCVAAGYSGVVVVEGRSIPEAQQSLEVIRRCFV